jgi:hypothetical protein
MSKAHRLKPRKPTALAASLNFLLGASDRELDQFELVKLATVSDLRRELHDTLDKIIEQTATAALARWFRQQDRESLRAALESEESALEWARRTVRERGRSKEELIPLPVMAPGEAHRAAALLYQARNIAEGKCQSCPRPLAHHSVRYCQVHLDAANARYAEKSKKLGKAPKGHHPRSLAALKKNREATFA